LQRRSRVGATRRWQRGAGSRRAAIANASLGRSVGLATGGGVHCLLWLQHRASALRSAALGIRQRLAGFASSTFSSSVCGCWLALFQSSRPPTGRQS
jgi:hypothetical protein